MEEQKMEEKKAVLIRALRDWTLRDDETETTIHLRKGEETIIPFRFFKRLIQLKIAVPGGLSFGAPVRMFS